ncbi:AhpC/TSA family protein [Neorhodopirellula lusitana]|uniref:AhpC/TSA family protein n=1 Tax=Neorhodopirellula lusitana TaxID=445327 RepID=A0ABY1QR87_9BACT|nr:redoxin domain-containing protein [Neorhodopirellula lusitana]SMP75553.1 AhpC/TSA family protein [Neorhodopirellula lusitana]
MGWKISLIAILLPGVVGMSQLMSYSNTPGETRTTVPQVIPTELISTTLSDEKRAQSKVLVFYHPHCPCTRATIRSLQRLESMFAPDTQIVGYAYQPASKDDNWIETTTTQALRSLQNATVLADRDAQACEDFEIVTSGHVLVYDHNGELKFSGGITPSRGHEGSCASGTAFLNSVNGKTNAEQSWPVFGCPIVRNGEGP